MKRSELIEKLKHSEPVVFWLYTRISFALFIGAEIVIAYFIFLLGHRYFP